MNDTGNIGKAFIVAPEGFYCSIWFINLSVNVSKLGTAVTQLTESYGQFDSGINENTDGVAEVTTDTTETAKKLNFWQKLLKLFGLYKE
mgnify:FL=1